MLIALSAIATYYIYFGSASKALGKTTEQIINSETFIFPGTSMTLQRTYTGIMAVDILLSILVSSFLTGAAGWNEAFRLQQIDFLFSVVPILTMLSSEAARKRNAWTVISLYVLARIS
jgi:hypothetical protein